MRSSRLTPIIICVIVGATGGLAVNIVVMASPIIGIVLGALYGLIFALLAGARAIRPGRGSALGPRLCLHSVDCNSCGYSARTDGRDA